MRLFQWYIYICCAFVNEFQSLVRCVYECVWFGGMRFFQLVSMICVWFVQWVSMIAGCLVSDCSMVLYGFHSVSKICAWVVQCVYAFVVSLRFLFVYISSSMAFYYCCIRVSMNFYVCCFVVKWVSIMCVWCFFECLWLLYSWEIP